MSVCTKEMDHSPVSVTLSVKAVKPDHFYCYCALLVYFQSWFAEWSINCQVFSKVFTSLSALSSEVR